MKIVHTFRILYNNVRKLLPVWLRFCMECAGDASVMLYLSAPCKSAGLHNKKTVHIVMMRTV